MFFVQEPAKNKLITGYDISFPTPSIIMASLTFVFRTTLCNLRLMPMKVGLVIELGLQKARKKMKYQNNLAYPCRRY